MDAATRKENIAVNNRATRHGAHIAVNNRATRHGAHIAANNRATRHGAHIAVDNRATRHGAHIAVNNRANVTVHTPTDDAVFCSWFPMVGHMTVVGTTSAYGQKRLASYCACVASVYALSPPSSHTLIPRPAEYVR